MSALPFDSATYAVELEAKANRLRELLAPFDAP
jgi:tRNA (uracil-5-)-methyltransferase